MNSNIEIQNNTTIDKNEIIKILQNKIIELEKNVEKYKKESETNFRKYKKERRENYFIHFSNKF